MRVRNIDTNPKVLFAVAALVACMVVVTSWPSAGSGVSPAGDPTAQASLTARASQHAMSSPLPKISPPVPPVSGCLPTKQSQETAACTPQGPVMGAAAGTGSAGIGGAIAQALAKVATQKLAGFALSQIGLDELLDPNTKRYDALQAQLDEMKSQIATLQTSVNQIASELKEVQLNQFLVPLTHHVTEINGTYNGYYRPMLNELEDYAEAQHEAVGAGLTCDDSDACMTARSEFKSARDNFKERAKKNYDDNSHLHEFLVSNRAGGSVLKAYGEYIMGGRGSTGFLTAADSDRLFAFYQYFAEYEALATWMKADYNSDRWQKQPREFDTFVNDEVAGYQAEERAALPARIPQGAVISLPVLVGERTTTQNRPMWMWDWTGRMLAGPGLDLLPTRSWDPSKPLTEFASVPVSLTALNTTSAGGGFQNWRVPSRADFAGLFAGQSAKFPNHDVSEFLDGILPQPPDITSWGMYRFKKVGPGLLWTSDVSASLDWTGATNGDATCALSASDRVTMGGYAHTGFSFGNELTGDPSKILLSYLPSLRTPPTTKPVTLTPPGGVTRDQRIQWCTEELARQVTAAPTNLGRTAQLVVTRSTGSQQFMP